MARFNPRRAPTPRDTALRSDDLPRDFRIAPVFSDVEVRAPGAHRALPKTSAHTEARYLGGVLTLTISRRPNGTARRIAAD